MKIKSSLLDLRQHQQGSTSMAISMIIMAILILMTLSLQRIIQVHFNEMIDVQFNLQAHYAAEAGITDARFELYRALTEGRDLQDVVDDHECDDIEVVYGGGETPVPGVERGLIDYQCLTIDLSPPTLTYDRLSQDRSLALVLRVKDSGGFYLPLQDLIISWDQPEASIRSKYPSGTDSPLLPYDEWGNISNVALLRAHISVIDFNSPVNRETFNSQTKTIFLYPNQSSINTFDWVNDDSGIIIGGHCGHRTSSQLACQSKLDNLDHGLSSGTQEIAYILRLQMIYSDAKITISSTTTNAPGSTLGFQDVQASIQATGRSMDIYKRLEERVPIQPIFDLPEYVIDSADDLCKVLVAVDGYGVFIDPDVSKYVGNWVEQSDVPPACRIRESTADWGPLLQ